MYVVRIEVAFDAGHRLLDYPGKCAQPHGHSYRAEISVAKPELDALGLAVDFGELKDGLKGWIDDRWDHGFLANDRDDLLISALRALPECKLYLFRETNPTAEAMARELFEEARGRFGSIVRSVRIWESPNQYAEFLAPEAPASPIARQEGVHA
jgi:6-pyruvoyltetrahydropterin/6-carboxytetrahydropterin synthase